MKEKTTTNEASYKKNPMAQMSEQAFKNWEKVFRSGLKLQGQANEWWGHFPDSASLAQEWQKQVTQLSSVVGAALPEGQKQLESALDLMVENNRKGQELFQRALDAARTPVLAESQAKWRELWSDSVSALRSNTEAITRLQTQAVDACIQFIQKNGEAGATRAQAA